MKIRTSVTFIVIFKEIRGEHSFLVKELSWYTYCSIQPSVGQHLIFGGQQNPPRVAKMCSYYLSYFTCNPMWTHSDDLFDISEGPVNDNLQKRYCNCQQLEMGPKKVREGKRTCRHEKALGWIEISALRRIQ